MDAMYAAGGNGPPGQIQASGAISMDMPTPAE